MDWILKDAKPGEPVLISSEVGMVPNIASALKPHLETLRQQRRPLVDQNTARDENGRVLDFKTMTEDELRKAESALFPNSYANSPRLYSGKALG